MKREKSLLKCVLNRFDTIREFMALKSTMLELDGNGVDEDYQLRYVNTINTWAEPLNAQGITPNTVIDSNDEPPGNNQQRLQTRGYAHASSAHMHTSMF